MSNTFNSVNDATNVLEELKKSLVASWQGADNAYRYLVQTVEAQGHQLNNLQQHIYRVEAANRQKTAEKAMVEETLALVQGQIKAKENETAEKWKEWAMGNVKKFHDVGTKFQQVQSAYRSACAEIDVLRKKLAEADQRALHSEQRAANSEQRAIELEKRSADSEGRFTGSPLQKSGLSMDQLRRVEEALKAELAARSETLRKRAQAATETLTKVLNASQDQTKALEEQVRILKDENEQLHALKLAKEPTVVSRNEDGTITVTPSQFPLLSSPLHSPIPVIPSFQPQPVASTSGGDGVGVSSSTPRLGSNSTTPLPPDSRTSSAGSSSHVVSGKYHPNLVDNTSVNQLQGVAAPAAAGSSSNINQSQDMSVPLMASSSSNSNQNKNPNSNMNFSTHPNPTPIPHNPKPILNRNLSQSQYPNSNPNPTYPNHALDWTRSPNSNINTNASASTMINTYAPHALPFPHAQPPSHSHLQSKSPKPPFQLFPNKTNPEVPQEIIDLTGSPPPLIVELGDVNTSANGSHNTSFNNNERPLKRQRVEEGASQGQ